MPGPATPRSRTGRTARASAEVWTLTVVVHTAAGGELPSAPWLVGLAGLVALATAWVLRGVVRPSVMLPILALGQVAMHEVLAGLTAGHAHAGHSNPHHPMAGGGVTAWVAELTPRMVLAHVLCATLTAVVWWLRRHVVHVVLALEKPAAVARPPRVGVRARSDKAPPLLRLATARGRAPPWALAPA